MMVEIHFWILTNIEDSKGTIITPSRTKLGDLYLEIYTTADYVI